MSAPIVVPIVRVRGASVALPRYMSPGAAGVDLAAAVEDAVTIPAGGRALIPTGVAIALPEGFEGQVRPRSGLAHRHGITVLNSPGTIDSDYRGEIQVLLVNLGGESATIRAGDRIAQLVVAPVRQVTWRECADLEPTNRGTGGYGSTGAR